MKCPSCGSSDTHVVDTVRDPSGGIRRRRACKECGKRFSTVERIVESTPQIVKRGGRRETFSRDKILEGVKIACAKRPVSMAAIDRLIDSVEAQVGGLNKSEVPAREVGDSGTEQEHNRNVAILRRPDETHFHRTHFDASGQSFVITLA